MQAKIDLATFIQLTFGSQVCCAEVLRCASQLAELTEMHISGSGLRWAASTIYATLMMAPLHLGTLTLCLNELRWDLQSMNVGQLDLAPLLCSF